MTDIPTFFKRLYRASWVSAAVVYAQRLYLARYLALRWFWFRSAALPSRRALGQGLVEYALILVLIAIVVIGAVTILGNQTSQVYTEVECEMRGPGWEWHEDSGKGNSNKCKQKNGGGGGNNGGANNNGGGNNNNGGGNNNNGGGNNRGGNNKP